MRRDGCRRRGCWVGSPRRHSENKPKRPKLGRGSGAPRRAAPRCAARSCARSPLRPGSLRQGVGCFGSPGERAGFAPAAPAAPARRGIQGRSAVVGVSSSCSWPRSGASKGSKGGRHTGETEKAGGRKGAGRSRALAAQVVGARGSFWGPLRPRTRGARRQAAGAVVWVSALATVRGGLAQWQRRAAGKQLARAQVVAGVSRECVCVYAVCV